MFEWGCTGNKFGKVPYPKSNKKPKKELGYGGKDTVKCILCREEYLKVDCLYYEFSHKGYKRFICKKCGETYTGKYVLMGY